jgi:hypothetical protein
MCEIADFAIPTNNFWKHQEKDVCCCIPVSVVCSLSTIFHILDVHVLKLFWRQTAADQQKNTVSRQLPAFTRVSKRAASLAYGSTGVGLG